MKFILSVLVAISFIFHLSQPTNAASNDIGPWKYGSEKTGFGKSIYFQTTSKVGSDTYIFTVSCLDTGESSHSITVFGSQGIVYWPKGTHSGLLKIGKGKIQKMGYTSYTSQKGIYFQNSPTLGVLTGLRNQNSFTFKAYSFEGDAYQATFKTTGESKVFLALKANGCKK